MKTHSHGLLLLVSAALAVLAPHSLAGDLFVGAGHPFSEIDPAIAAAAPGDRIFVDSGTFLPFDLTKAVEIRGAGATNTRIHGATPGDYTTVSGVPAGATATLANMAFDHVDPAALSDHPLVELTGNAGTVVLQDVKVNLSPMAPHQGPGMRVQSNARLIIQGCSIKGSVGIPTGSVGEPALLAEDSLLVVSDSDFVATDFYFGEFALGFEGEPGIALVDCDAWFARVQATGGLGGLDVFSFTEHPGGPAVDLINSSLDLAGGPGNMLMGGKGHGLFPGGPPGGAGLRLATNSTARIAQDALLIGGLDSSGTINAIPLEVDASSSATRLLFPLPTLALPQSQVNVGGPYTLNHAGAPAALVVPLYSHPLGPAQVIAGLDGLVHLDSASLFVLPTIMLDALGLGATNGTIPAHPALTGSHVWIQAAEITPAATRLSNPARLMF